MRTLSEALTQYIYIRRTLGAKFQEPAMTLGHFVTFLETEGADYITTNLALRWACQSTHVQRATWARRLGMVRRFASWLNAFDSRTEIPPKRILHARHRRPKPYIYTDQEIEHLMAEASYLPSTKGLRSLTHVTLIGLLATTGLRPREALALNMSDVDLANGILAIRNTKFGKSRFVPVTDSTCAALAQYAKKRLSVCPSGKRA
jgi:integrase